MSAALDARGLTLWQARADMIWLAQVRGSHAKVCELLGLSSSTWHSALGGTYGPGERVLEAIYGPTGKAILPSLLSGAGCAAAEAQHVDLDQGVVAWAEVSCTPSIMDDCVHHQPIAAPAPGVAGPIGLTVAQLLDLAELRALQLENDLDEALGEIVSLKAMAARFAEGR